MLNKYDNMGRMIASGVYTGDGSGDVTSSDDPTSRTTDRLALSQTFYDERGQVWKTQRHKIDDADGSDDDQLLTLNWYDAPGRVIKVDGEQLTKTFYDRVSRVTHRFTLASTDDSAYGDADDLSGDIVLEEHQTTYDPVDGNSIMSAMIARFHDDYGGSETTGAMDTNADGDALMYTAANLEGRIQIVASWHDRFDRVIDTVNYGTNGGSNLDRDGLSTPARSDTALRTTYAYNTDGTLQDVTDPKALVTRHEYDAAGRQTVVISNYLNGTPSGATGADDNFVRYAYTNGLRTKMWVDIDGDGTEDADDQVTTYTYGVTKGASAGDSKISSGGLLYKVVYPDVESGETETDHRVLFAYNAQGQQIWTKDQAGNIIEDVFDTAGRRTDRKLTTVASGFDNAVLRITTAYEALGRVSTVTQYDATSGGNDLDQVKYTYDDWGPILKVEMDRQSLVGESGSVDDYEVSYVYEEAGSGAENGRNTIRRTEATYPDGNVITYTYSSTGSRHDDWASRISQVKDASIILAEYSYNGQSHVVSNALRELSIYSQLHSSTPGSYPDLDRFDRVITSSWYKDLATDRYFFDSDITYDRNGNITLVEDNVHKSGSDNTFDVSYGIDGLNRLTRAEEGNWTGGTINPRSRQEIWTLSQTGNWNVRQLDLNGNNTFTDSGDLNENNPVTGGSSHFSLANEWKARDTNNDGTDNYTLIYDKAGHMTDDGKDYEYEWDPLGRLRKVKTRSDVLVAEFTYYGTGWMKSVHYDVDADGTVENTSHDPWYHYAYDDPGSWRMLAVFRDTDSVPKEAFVPHMAGMNGLGSSSKLDDVICRNKDANTAWATACDGTLEERIYQCQNWRGDVVARIKLNGAATEQSEQARASAYGVPFGEPPADIDADGDVDSADVTQITTWSSSATYEVRGDLNLDNSVNSTDVTLATGHSGTNLGYGKLSRPGVRSRQGYAGYETSFFNDSVLHVRHRVLKADLGRWLSRDPLGYVDGSNVYEYGTSNPVSTIDPTGTVCVGGGCGISQGGQLQNPPSAITVPMQEISTPPPGLIVITDCHNSACIHFEIASFELTPGQERSIGQNLQCSSDDPIEIIPPGIFPGVPHGWSFDPPQFAKELITGSCRRTLEAWLRRTSNVTCHNPEIVQINPPNNPAITPPELYPPPSLFDPSNEHPFNELVPPPCNCNPLTTPMNIATFGPITVYCFPPPGHILGFCEWQGQGIAYDVTIRVSIGVCSTNIPPPAVQYENSIPTDL